MASSSSRQGAREPPPPDQLAALYSLTDKFVSAGALSRHSRTAELAARAALKAEALLGDDSLVVADLRMNESEALNNMAATASGAEKDALFRRSLSGLLSVIALLQRRISANTLLFGAVRKEEFDYCIHVQAASFAANNEPVPPPADLASMGSSIGYVVLLDAMFRSLHFLFVSFRSSWPAAQRKVVESFVRALLSSFPTLLLTGVTTGHYLFRYFKP